MILYFFTVDYMQKLIINFFKLHYQLVRTRIGW